MEKSPQTFDVCIVCALPEEARAFLEVAQQQCESTIEERMSPRYQSSYRFATLKNDKGEPLNLHVSWLPRYGPQEMTLHLSRVLEECQPRIVIMTGICAGDSQHVQLGDLIVAERTFTYDNGKFILDEHGRRIHLHDTMTYQLDANILQFLGLFDDWKPLVAHLKRPLSSPERRKRRTIACHIKPMASGSAVRSDNPFEDVQAPVRGTVAIDMEGAAFGLVMNRHPLTRWLVVKGVCDYADKTKNDAYHDYAAHASALYALGFIRAYVTNERLPRLDGPSLSSRTGPSKVWNIPFARNPFFTGRDRELTYLHTQLQQSHTATVGQPQAISGLGGIGKTQLAIEYAYRYQQDYQTILWARGENQETLIASYNEIATLLNLPEKDALEQEVIVQAVKDWLITRQNWLLILDNIDEPEVLVPFIPLAPSGHLLVTTRVAELSNLDLGFGHALTVETFPDDLGAQFLLQRAGLEQLSPQNREIAREIAHELGGLPLALDQAGAYLKTTGKSLALYWELYQQQPTTLLNERQSRVYPASVATTWNLSFQNVEKQNPAAADLLRLCAFLAPDAIPEEVLTDGAEELGYVLAPVAANPYYLDQAIAALRAYSLIVRDSATNTLSVHRLVQAVVGDALPVEVQQQWKLRAILALNATFPNVEFASWPTCDHLLPHVLRCTTWIEQEHQVKPEAAHLLNQTGAYLRERGRYAEAEPFFRSALHIREQQLGTKHSDTVISLNNLATLYWDRGKYAEAEPLYERALHTMEQLGVENSKTAISLNNLAAIYLEQGKYAKAEPLYERALRISEQQLGSEHPDMAYPLINLASLYFKQRKYAEAESHSQRALRIREQQLGAAHPDTATSLNHLANLYLDQGRYAEAEPLYERALRIREQRLGLEHPYTAESLNNLALLYGQQGKYAEAEPLYERALRISEQQLGSEHPDMAISLNNLAFLYGQQGKYAEAEPLYERALRISEQQLGSGHLKAAYPLINLASLYFKQRKYVEAKPLYGRALSIYEYVLGREHPDTQTVRKNYAILLQAMGFDEGAKKLEEESS